MLRLLYEFYPVAGGQKVRDLGQGLDRALPEGAARAGLRHGRRALQRRRPVRKPTETTETIAAVVEQLERPVAVVIGTNYFAERSHLHGRMAERAEGRVRTVSMAGRVEVRGRMELGPSQWVWEVDACRRGRV